MPQFTCESCGTGLYSAARAGSLVDPACPACGGALAFQRPIEPDADGRVEPMPVAVIGSP